MMRDVILYGSMKATSDTEVRRRALGDVSRGDAWAIREPDRKESADAVVLSGFREVLDEIYGERLDRVVLFGSRARGDASPGSDYDIAVFLKTLPDRWGEIRRLADLRVDFIDRTGVFLDAKPFSIASWSHHTPLMHDIRRDGRDI